MENSKEILKVTRRLRNIDGCIIAELDKGRRTTVNPKVIEGFIEFLCDSEPESLEVEETTMFLLRSRLINLLAINGYEVRLK